VSSSSKNESLIIFSIKPTSKEILIPLFVEITALLKQLFKTKFFQPNILVSVSDALMPEYKYYPFPSGKGLKKEI
jgi:hypothetical protein